MTETKSGHSQANIPAWILLAVLFAAAAALGAPGLAKAMAFPNPLERDALRELSKARPGKGRLFLTSSAHPHSVLDETQIARAQLRALSLPEAPTRQRIQGLIYLARGEWEKAAQIFEQLRVNHPNRPEILNDLGAAYMALGEESPLQYFKALGLFDLARQMAPNAAAPQFNIARVYGAVGLRDLEARAAQEYRRIERDPAWLTESSAPIAPNEAKVIGDLRAALSLGNRQEAERLFEDNAEICRRAATEYAFNPSVGADDPVSMFVAAQLEARYRDRTVAAMLSPLGSMNRAKVIQARQFVRAGTDAYLGARLADSLKLYAQASLMIKGVDSMFDRLWIDLNRADAENRLGNIAATRRLLDNVIAISRSENFRWLLGLALASKGSALPLADSYANHLSILEESEQILSSVAASRDSGRPLYYAAMARSFAGNAEDSIRFVFRALKVTRREDHLRQTQLFALAGSALYRLGYPRYAISFEEMSVAEARETANLPILGTATSYLASMYEANLQYDQAERYMTLAREIVDKIDVPIQRRQVSFPLNLVCGRIYIRKGNPEKASKCLQENLDIFAREPSPLRLYLSQSILLLAKAHSISNRYDEARAAFRQAIDVVETDDTYLATEKLRLPFENERRDLYDSAINFEYDHGGLDAAWSDAQRYRSKLFLEFLGQANPVLDEVHTEAIDRDKVQKLAPRNLQVVEYVMLNDRLLIWLVSDRIFTSRSIPITRAALEQKVAEFVTGIRGQEDIRGESEELYQILVAPIEDLLDSTRAIAIIPDQALHRLPFAALHSTHSNSYLVQQYTILESPNLTHLLATHADLPPRNSAVTFGLRMDDISVERELSAVGKFYRDIRRFAGETADKSNFLTAMKNASMFHYAGHSEDAADPLRSSVLLDGVRNGPNSVTAMDISKQRMRPNSIVVLASCDSSVGNSRDGIGMRGLTSAFLIAGAGAVVGSLWPVETTSTSDLMVLFHEAFATTKKPVAQALRQAQLSFLGTFPEKSHPYYWSSFMVTGNTSALQ